MRNKRFIQRLNQVLPLWIEKGWVSRVNAEEIIKSLSESDTTSPNRLIFFLSLFGVILFGTGVITFFAAHWNGIPKIEKLIILFGGMWSACGLSIYFKERRQSSPLWHLFLLLGVILFGSNIFLISQIYHIDSHYPNGVLLWSVGGWVAAVLMESQLSMIPAIMLSIIWSGFEIFDFQQDFFWPFLILWGSFLIPIFRHEWKTALHVALPALLLWSFMVFQRAAFWHDGSQVFLIQIYFLAYLGVYLLGRVMETFPKTASFSRIFQNYSLLAQLICIYVLTFPHFNRNAGWLRLAPSFQTPSPVHWIAVTSFFVAMGIALVLWLRQRTGEFARTPVMMMGYLLTAVILLIMLLNGISPGTQESLIALFFNLVFFSGLVWLVYAGVQNQDPFMVNLSFAFFALTVLTRYFDTFWSLLNRSYFFMLGGLLLIAGGLLLEKQRRKLTRTMG